MTDNTDYIYNGVALSSMNLWALGKLLDHLTNQEDARAKASMHKKFNDRTTKLKLPPPNPEFLKLKDAVEAEIRKKQENV